MSLNNRFNKHPNSNKTNPFFNISKYRKGISMDKNWIKIAAIFVGTVIGAGFASGREIIEFFGVYGTKGLWGIYIVGILFSTCASILLFKIYKYKIRDLDHLL